MAKAERVLSIEVGYSLTQVCEMDYRSKHPQVYGVFSMKTPEGIFDDGYVRVDDRFVEELKSYLDANGMHAKKVIFVISSTKVANREAMIPVVKEHKVRELVMSNITDYFPVDPSMYQFEHTIMDTVTDEVGNKQFHLMLIAAPSEILESYSVLAQKLGLDLEYIDYSGNSIFQALKGKFTQGVNLTVKIDERSSLITVTNNGVITMQRAGMYGADQVVEVLLDSDVYDEQMTYDTAVQNLRRNNLVIRPEEEETLAQREADAEGIAKAHADTLAEATALGDQRSMAAASLAAKQAEENLKRLRLRKEVTYSYQQLISSIVRVIDYYNSRNREESIDKIVLTGIAADFWGFSGLLSEELGREVEVLRDLAGTNIKQGIHLQGVSIGDYVTVIGGALGTTGFLPASVELAAQEAKSGVNADISKEHIPLIAAVLLFVAIIVVLTLSIPPYLSEKSKNESLVAEKVRLEEIIPIYEKHEQTKLDYNYLTEVFSKTDNHNRNLTDLFLYLEKCMPAGAFLEGLEVSEDTFTMIATFKTKREAAQTLMNVRKYDNFFDVLANTLEREYKEKENIELYHMTIMAVYGLNPDVVLEEAEDSEIEENEEAVED